MPICPYCKKEFAAKSIEKELIEGIADGPNMLGKVTYSCPHCRCFLAVGDVTPNQMSFG